MLSIDCKRGDRFGILSFFPMFVMLCTLLASTTNLLAQPFRHEIGPITVQGPSGEPMLNPFSGGLDLTRIGLVDVDGDSDLDLFALNISERLRLYVNDGSAAFRRIESPVWESLPVRSWFRLVDIDDDGDVDLYTSGERSELMVLRNTGSSSAPLFSSPDTVRQSNSSVIFSEQLTVPTFADIDNDEDFDLFSGNVDGTITYYENVGSKKEPDFLFRSRKFEGLLVISPARAEREEKDVSTSSARHGASVLDFVDLDGDLDLDILFGDFFTTKMLHFENRGTPRVPDFDTLWVDSAFAPSGDIVESVGFNQAVSGDLDGDTDFDVLVSSLLASASNRPMELFINQGDRRNPVMRRAGTNPTSEIDVGRFSSPVYLKDNEREGLLVGSEDGSISWYTMREKDNRTVLQLTRRYILDGVTLSSPAVGDLDGDKKAEIVVGKGDVLDGTTLRLYQFDGNELARLSWQLDTTFNIARSSASPTLADLDNDKDLDLFVGARNGRFYLFENIGSPTSYVFEVATPPAPFDTLDLGADAAPCFADIDNDGDLDVIVGSRQSESLDYDTLRFWVNDQGSFREDIAWPAMAVARNPVPLYVKVREGNFLLVGNRPGGLIAFRDSTQSSSVAGNQARSSNGRVQVIAETKQHQIVVKWDSLPAESREFVLVDIGGSEHHRLYLDQATGSLRLSLQGLSSGLYLWSVEGLHRGFIIVVR